MSGVDVAELKAQMPMPNLMQKLGLGDYCRKSCRSPFRDDKKPSFSVYQDGGMWFFKDHATGQSGDEIIFIATLYQLDPRRDFKEVVARYADLAGCSSRIFTAKPAPKRPTKKVNLEGFYRPTRYELCPIAEGRPLSIAGLEWAADRGLLMIGKLFGHEVYVVTDITNQIAEARRVDGGEFRGGRKCHALPGSNKGWPVGITEATNYPAIAILEGIPDLIEAHNYILFEQASHRDKRDVHCLPVGMLGASTVISEEALPFFTGKHVRIFCHNDKAGRAAGEKWATQIHSHSPVKIDFFSFEGITDDDGCEISDLYDTTRRASRDSWNQHENLHQMFPQCQA